MTTVISFVILLLAHYAVGQDIGKSCTVEYTNSPGTCKLTTDCLTAKQQAERGIRPTICGFDSNSIPIVCCQAQIEANENSFLEFPVTNTDSSIIYPEENEESVVPTTSLSDRKCMEYSQPLVDELSILPLIVGAKPTTYNITTCDYNGIPLIVGGEPARLGEFPFMAAIGFRNSDNEVNWKCGGTLISDKFVMTASHCTYSRDDGAPVKVRLGELDLKRTDEGANPVDYDIEQIIKHPNYKSPMKYNDIALLKLRNKVTFNKHIRPACLWNSPTIQQKKAIATGWGLLEQSGDPSDRLQKVALNVISNTFCQNTYTHNVGRVLPNGIINSMLCAGELKGGKDTCQGDSGGPLFVTKDNNCIFHVVGITSFGRACASVNTPAIYTRVSSYISWIEKTIW